MVIQDSADKHKSALKRLRRLYDALRHMNHAVVHARTREDLFREVCRAAVEHGGFLIAWVGWHDAQTSKIVPVARWGDDKNFLDNVEIYADERPEGWGPTGLTFRAAKPYICNDFHRDPVTEPWRDRAKRSGIKASANFPIRMQGRVCGVFGVYAKEREYFQSSEVGLLEEAAADLSFALDNLAREEERRRAEEAMKRLADIVESSPAAIVSAAPDGTIMSWNPAAQRIFGYSAAEIVGANISALIPEDRVRERAEIVARITRGERTVDFETVRVRKGGERFPVAITMSPIRSAAGEIIGASKIIRDITERKNAEAAVREAQAQIKAVVEHLQVGILIVDMDHNILQWNPAVNTIIGFDQATDLPRKVEGLSKYFEVSTLERVNVAEEQLPLARVMRGENVQDLEVRVRRIDTGREGIFSISGTVVPDVAGKDMAFVTIRDVTEHKRAEEALRLSEARLRAAQRIANVGSWEWDVPNDHLYWSDQMFEIFGMGKDEFGGNYASFLGRVHPSDREAVDSALRATLATGWPLNVEYRVPMPDGSEKYLYVCCGDERRDGNGRVIWVSGTALDITARRRAAEALREANARLEYRVRERTAELAVAKERAESADRLKSAFLATMSHELRTPLNSIIGFTGMVLQGLAGPLNAEQSKQLAVVQNSARHLLSLINDVLDISKIEAGQMKLHLEAFALDAMVSKVLATIEPLAQKKGLKLVLESTPVQVEVVSDQRRVEQVLLNLLHNAVKFTERGKVTLSVALLGARVLPAAAEPQPCVQFRVSDTGIGIAAADLAHLFRPFRQINTHLTPQHEGTGLGLNICRRLVDLLGGEIEVDSRLGVGSTFTFYIPQRRQNGMSSSNSSLPPAEAGAGAD